MHAVDGATSSGSQLVLDGKLRSAIAAYEVTRADPHRAATVHSSDLTAVIASLTP